MTSAAPFLAAGVLAGILACALVGLGVSRSSTATLAAALVPLLGLLGFALFYPEAARWPRRLGAATLGGLGAALLGAATLYWLKTADAWLRWPDEHGAELFLLIVLLFGVLAGTLAAAPLRWERGLALPAGLMGTVLAAYAASQQLPGSRGNLDTVALLAVVSAVGLAAGLAVGHLLASSAPGG